MSWFRLGVLMAASLWLSGAGAFAATAPATPAPAANGFEAANRLSAEGKFSESAAAYDALAAGGRTSAALEYNRAQARFKAGQPGRAWAHVLLAGRLDPRDRATRLAAEQIGVRIPAGGTPSIGAGSWIHAVTLNEWGGAALVLTWIWGALALAGLVSPAWRLRARAATWTAGILAVVVTSLLGAAMWGRWRDPDAVVLRPETAIRVSPLDEARTAFSLPEGSEVRSRDVRGDWVMVEDPQSRRFGWARRGDVMVLPFR